MTWPTPWQTTSRRLGHGQRAMTTCAGAQCAVFVMHCMTMVNTTPLLSGARGFVVKRMYVCGQAHMCVCGQAHVVVKRACVFVVKRAVLSATCHTPQVLSMASSLPLDRPSATYGGATESQQLAQQPSGSSPGDIVAITAAACNTVWVGCDNGLLEQYTSMGRLLNSVCAGCVDCVDICDDSVY